VIKGRTGIISRVLPLKGGGEGVPVHAHADGAVVREDNVILRRRQMTTHYTCDG